MYTIFLIWSSLMNYLDVAVELCGFIRLICSPAWSISMSMSSANPVATKALWSQSSNMHWFFTAHWSVPRGKPLISSTSWWCEASMWVCFGSPPPSSTHFSAALYALGAGCRWCLVFSSCVLLFDLHISLSEHTLSVSYRNELSPPRLRAWLCHGGWSSFVVLMFFHHLFDFILW